MTKPSDHLGASSELTPAQGQVPSVLGQCLIYRDTEELSQSSHSPSQHTFTEAKHQKTQAFIPSWGFTQIPKSLTCQRSLVFETWTSDVAPPCLELLTIANPALYVSGQLVPGHGLSAAWAPPKVVPFVTVSQQVLCQAADLQHLQHSQQGLCWASRDGIQQLSLTLQNDKGKIPFQSSY